MKQSLCVEIERSVHEGREYFAWQFFATILVLFLVLQGSKLAGASKALASFVVCLQSIAIG